MARTSFLFRTDPAVLEALKKWADDDLRSVNGQIEFILKQAVMRRTGRAPEPESGDPSPDEERP